MTVPFCCNFFCHVTYWLLRFRVHLYFGVGVDALVRHCGSLWMLATVGGWSATRACSSHLQCSCCGLVVRLAEVVAGGRWDGCAPQATPFDVTQTYSNEWPSKVWVMVGMDGVSIHEKHCRTPLAAYPFSQIHSFGAPISQKYVRVHNIAPKCLLASH
jgi:hypothetical protein